MQEHHDDTRDSRLGAGLPGLRTTTTTGDRPIPVAEPQRRFGFRIGPFHLLLTPGTFSEVVRQAVIYPLPNVPPWFLGLLNQRSTLLPVFDLHRLLDTGDTPPRQRTILVLDQGREAVGLPIDGLPQAITLSPPLPQVPALPTDRKSVV